MWLVKTQFPAPAGSLIGNSLLLLSADAGVRQACRSQHSRLLSALVHKAATASAMRCMSMSATESLPQPWHSLLVWSHARLCDAHQTDHSLLGHHLLLGSCKHSNQHQQSHRSEQAQQFSSHKPSLCRQMAKCRIDMLAKMFDNCMLFLRANVRVSPALLLPRCQLACPVNGCRAHTVVAKADNVCSAPSGEFRSSSTTWAK